METKLENTLKRLNPAQRKAVENYEGPMLVIAGAGSGKTSVLTCRIALMIENGINPENILALTFTKKAAKEMTERIISLVGDNGKNVMMGTFHSIFAKLIRPYAHLLGFGYNFTILDEEDAKTVLTKSRDRILDSNRPPKEEWTEEAKLIYEEENKQYNPRRLTNRISSLKNRLITPDDYSQSPGYIDHDSNSGIPEFHKIFKEYRDSCFRSNCMDFDDLLLYTDMLMANFPDVQKEIASRFKYILVDEYQDTNEAQYSVISRLTLTNNNICVVGDDSQSIYAFRGAQIANIFNFQNDYHGQTIKLEQNYRSTPQIVSAANRLISHNENRIPKECFTNIEKGEYISVKECETDRHEADYISVVIKNRHKEIGTEYSQFAVLYRTNAQSRLLEESMIKHGIPYVIYSGTSFYERAEIKDMLAWFKLSVNPDDNVSLLRVINKPSRGIGNKALTSIETLSTKNNESIWQFINRLNYSTELTPSAIKGIEEFKSIFENILDIAKKQNAYETALSIKDKTNIYKIYDSNNKEDRDRVNNIEELLNAVKYFVDNESENSMSDYLQNVMLLSNADTENTNSVNLMTVHCAKGLEYDCVFVAGLEEDLFPLNIEHTQTEEEEERRLFYVAVTRAKKKLFLTRAKSRMRKSRIKKNVPSHFISQLLTD